MLAADELLEPNSLTCTNDVGLRLIVSYMVDRSDPLDMDSGRFLPRVAGESGREARKQTNS